MAFNLLSFLTTVLAGFDVPEVEAQVVAWLKDKGAEYPDLQARTDALAAWLTQTIEEAAPELDPATMKDTILGIASDIVRGTAGVDSGAWLGAG